LMNAAIADGSEITVPSLTISPFPSTTLIDRLGEITSKMNQNARLKAP